MKKALYLILAGVAIGILIAPAKGSETWQKLMDGLDDMKDKVKDSADDLASTGKDLFNKGKSGAEKAAKEW